MIPYKPIDLLFKGTPFAIAPDPLMLITGFIIFVLICIYFLRDEKNFNVVSHIIFMILLILLSLEGGKIWHYFDMNAHHKENFFIYALNPAMGAITSYGMLVGGILGFILLTLLFKNKISSNIVDVLPIATAFWIFLYRIGCLLGGNSYGIKTNVFWALYYVDKGYARHPVQLYLSLSALFIFFVLFFRYRHRIFVGENALLFFLLYGFNRFWIEFFRYYKTRYLGISISQYLSFLMFFIALIILKRKYSKKKSKKASDLVGLYLSNKKFRLFINIIFILILIFSLIKPARLLIGSFIDKKEFRNCPYTIVGNISSNVKIKYFGSPYCPACWEEELIVFPPLLKKYGNEFYMEKYDIRFCKEEVEKYKVKGTPSFVFQNTEENKEFVSYGYLSLKQIKDSISKLKK